MSGKMKRAEKQFYQENGDIAEEQKLYRRRQQRKARHSRALILLLLVPGQLIKN